MNESLGSVVTSLGDVNGDGYADVAVTVPGKGGAYPIPHLGEVYAFYGSAVGLPAFPSKILVSNEFTLGNAAAGAGDVNGDGFDDLLLSDAAYANVGAALIYFGSAQGLPDQPSWVAFGPPDENPEGAAARFGKELSAAGDINADGYGDVLIRDPDADNGDVLSGGRVSLFLGGPSGPSTTADQVFRGQVQGGLLGAGAATAGDTNADGFDDVIMSEPGFPTSEGNGRVLVLLGTPLGLNEMPGWISNPEEGYLVAESVGTAGDVNHDGFADIIVGQRGWRSQGTGRSFTGRALVYHGSVSGPSKTPSWTVIGSKYSWLGDQAVTAGDVNGDGFGDVAISAPEPSAPSQSRFYVYLGGKRGLASKPALVVKTDEPYGYFAASLSSAGDTDRDGRSEVIVGDPGHDNASYTVLSLGEACLYKVP